MAKRSRLSRVAEWLRWEALIATTGRSGGGRGIDQMHEGTVRILSEVRSHHLGCLVVRSVGWLVGGWVVRLVGWWVSWWVRVGWLVSFWLVGALEGAVCILYQVPVLLDASTGGV